jgi:carboxypeptidase Q
MKLPLNAALRSASTVFVAGLSAGVLLVAACRGSGGQASAALAPVGRPSLAAGAEVDPAAVVARVIELGRGDNQVQEHLRHLCLEIGPRLTGSSNLRRAAEWARERFAEYGLEARLERWGELPVGFERGPARGAIVAPERREVAFLTEAWTPGTGGPRRGPALRFPRDAAELAALEGRIGGAWLVRGPRLEGERDFVREVRREVVEQGGLGVIRGAHGELLVMSGNHRVAWNDLPRLVEITLAKADHELVWERLEIGDAVELEFDIEQRFVEGPIELSNVVADLVGSELPEEYVIVGGHLDSWDGAQGAVDNGTGCATTLEAARLLAAAGARPRRTIRFVLWTGEEQGLLGSEAYVAAHPELMPRISAVLNHDGGTNYLSGLAVTEAMLPAMREACAPAIGLDPRFPFELVELEGLPAAGSSDHAPFVRRGVPGFFWRQAGRSSYQHHHHTQHDLFEAAIPEYQRHSATVAALVAFGLANRPELLDRTDLRAPEPRRMGVELDGTRIARVLDGSRAAAAGLAAGDVLVAIDGEAVEGAGGVTARIRGGGSVKTIRVRRGDGESATELEVTLDWSEDPDEPRRLRAIERRGERDAGAPARAGR